MEKSEWESVARQIAAHEKKIAETPLRTIKEWDEIFGIVVYDPDGFDRTDPYLYKRVFTEEEYLKGVQTSTCMFKREGLFYERYLKPMIEKYKEERREENV